MNPVNKYTFNNLPDEDRISNKNLTYNQKYLKALEKNEKLINDICPLTTTFDVSPMQDLYFSEYAYTNINKYIIVYAMNYEFNVRFLINHLTPLETDIDLFDDENLNDKYLLEDLGDTDFEEVIFLPGSNILGKIVDVDKIDRLVIQNKNILIKPHPITDSDDIRRLGMRYGYYRIIEPEVSGHQVMQNCKKVYYTENSEIGIKAILKGKETESVSLTSMNQLCAYFPIYSLIDRNKENKIQVIKSYFNGDYGVIDVTESLNVNKLKLQKYFDNSMKYREKFYPVIPPFNSEEYFRSSS